MNVTECPRAFKMRAQKAVFRSIVKASEQETSLRLSAPGSEAHIKSAQKAAVKSFVCAQLVDLEPYQVDSANRYGMNRARRRLGLRPRWGPPPPRQARRFQR